MTRPIRMLFALLIIAPIAAPSLAGEASLRDTVREIVREIANEYPTSWRRTQPLLERDTDAVPELIRMLQDREVRPNHRAIAIEALGRIGDPRAVRPLQRFAESEAASEHRRGVAVALYLLGESDLLSEELAELERLSQIPIGAKSAAFEMGTICFAVGDMTRARRFYAEALEQAMTDTMRGNVAMRLATCAAFDRDADAAIEAVKVALDGRPWMASLLRRHRDLELIHSNPSFIALIEEAEREAQDDAPADEETIDHPLAAEYEEFIQAYHAAANTFHVTHPEHSAYQAWLRSHLRVDSPEAREEYEAEHGGIGEDPTLPWIADLKTWLDRAAGTPLEAKVRGDLMHAYRTWFRGNDVIDLYLSRMVGTAIDEAFIARSSETALAFARFAGRSEGVRHSTIAVIRAIDDPETRGRLFGALGEDAAARGDRDEARQMLDRAINLLPEGSFRGDKARQLRGQIETVWTGKPAPDFTAADIDGNTITLSDLRGRVVLLNFWATWCGFCRPELDVLRELRKKHREDDLVVIGVALDDNGIALLRGMERYDIDWPQICDLKDHEGALPQLFHTSAVPRHILIDREGNVGPLNLRGAKLAEAVAELVNAPRADAGLR